MRKFPSIPYFLRVFIRNRHWSFSNAFIASTEVITCVFFFSLLICSYIIWFSNVKPIYNSWDKPHLVVMHFLNVFPVLFSKRQELKFMGRKKKLGKYNISFLIHYSVLVSNLSIREDYNLCLLLITSQYNF